MFSCRQIYDLITEYDEGSLATSERRQFEAHVVVCPPCRGFLSQMRATRDLLGHGTQPEFPAELEDSIVSAFQAWKRAQG
ncbi:MAG: zf-HC2 domain-containing protein [Actinomycetota bacterium]|nr:zf-HC2 domain-containing protein [Actinomycetota bacterium]